MGARGRSSSRRAGGLGACCALLVALAGPAVAGQVDLRATPRFALPNVTDIRHAGDGSNRLFLVQVTGTVRVVRDGTLLPAPFIDVSEQVSTGSERGLLSLAFSPRFATDGTFYLYYTDRFGRSTLARHRVGADPDQADPTSGQVILSVDQPFPNHNGGRLAFGPDGMLYLGIGDGGGAGDPGGNGQDLTNLLGTIVRLDVAVDEGYAIPADNPFAGRDDLPRELWAYGLRNPWRMAFDRETGGLFIADVGQDRFEEVNYQAPGDPGANNYGWNTYEADACFTSCTGGEPFTSPVHSYRHEGGNCSITGGEVYRGPDYPALDGVYLYGDFCSGRIWGLARDAAGGWQNELLLDTDLRLTTFGLDERGNIYAAGFDQVVLLSDGEPATAVGRPLDGSYSGSYAVPGLADQGFFVTIDDRPDGSRFAFVTWFTFEAGQPAWFAGVGEIASGADRFTVELLAYEGPAFLDFDAPPASRAVAGTITLRAVDCSRFEADYAFPGRASGRFDLERLTGIEGRACP